MLKMLMKGYHFVEGAKLKQQIIVACGVSGSQSVFMSSKSTKETLEGLKSQI